MLSSEQINSFHDNGYLRISGVYNADEVKKLCDDMDWMIQTWSETDKGWTGPWREALMDAEIRAKSKLTSMHDLHFYSESWMRGVTKPEIAEALSQLLRSDADGTEGAPVELHHTTMHVKPPETGHPFPMHQDWAFYKHADDRYIDALVHLDDTSHANGEIRFLKGSNKLGSLDHITSFVNDSGEQEECTPQLSQEEYRLEDTVAVPAKAGDLVLFNINTIHGSHVNTTKKMRRMVRVGYKHPSNRQISGQCIGRPGVMIKGQRTRGEGQALFGTGGPVDANTHSSG
jgi:hypothetical protein